MCKTKMGEGQLSYFLERLELKAHATLQLYIIERPKYLAKEIKTQ
jgi:hypothetical protein